MTRKFTRVPELSLKAFTHGDAKKRAEFIDALMEGFQYFGFIILKDHGVSTELLARAYKLSAEFFALPETEVAEKANLNKRDNPFPWPLNPFPIPFTPLENPLNST